MLAASLSNANSWLMRRQGPDSRSPPLFAGGLKPFKSQCCGGRALVDAPWTLKSAAENP
jgi:hypothetical protein